MNSVVLDFVLYGKDEAKLQYIISDKADTITDRLLIGTFSAKISVPVSTDKTLLIMTAIPVTPPGARFEESGYKPKVVRASI